MTTPGLSTVLDSPTRMLSWLSLLGNCDVEYNGKHLTKSRSRLPVDIGSSFYRKFTCVAGCIVCCANPSVSLDFIPSEIVRLDPIDQYLFSPRDVVVNGKTFPILSRAKPGKKPVAVRENDGSPYCSFLKPVRDNGGLGCSLWQVGSPLGCATAYNIRISEREDRVLITKQGPSRGWLYDPRPECIFEPVPVDEADLETNIALFDRMAVWADYFEIPAAVSRLFELTHFLRDVLWSKIATPIRID